MPSKTANNENAHDDDVDGVAVDCLCWPRSSGRSRKMDRKKKKQQQHLEVPTEQLTQKSDSLNGNSPVHYEPDIPHLRVSSSSSSTLPVPARRSLRRVSSIYHDAQDGRGLVPSPDDESDMDNSEVFMDARQGSSSDFVYPIVTTSSIRPKRSMSLLQPESLLMEEEQDQGEVEDVHDARHRANWIQQSHQKELSPMKMIREQSSTLSSPTNNTQQPTASTMDDSESGTVDNNNNKHDADADDDDLVPLRMRRNRSEQNTRTMSQRLKDPNVSISERGFPGSLRPQELEACLKLAAELEKDENAKLAQQVYCLSKTEEKPYALCRWLRSNQFQVKETLDQLRKHSPAWQKAQDEEFYPSISRDCLCHNAPVPVFLDLYPYLAIGTARNGCPVTYFAAGRARADGVFCMADVDAAKRFFWNQSMHAFPERLYQAQQKNPDMVRMESITVLDLEGLSSSSLNAEARQIIQASNEIGEYFPETMHCMVIINAPSAFVMFWKVASRFLDARMAQRIQVYRSGDRGMTRLRELIDPAEMPADYEGSKPTVAECVLEQQRESERREGGGGDDAPAAETYISELMFVRRRGQASAELTIPSGKKFSSLDVYTRSVSAARVEFSTGGKTTTIQAARGSNNSDSGCPIAPNRISVDLDHTADTVISVQVTDLDDVEKCKCNETHARGYFLVVGTLV